jgi:hypothetical protein
VVAASPRTQDLELALESILNTALRRHPPDRNGSMRKMWKGDSGRGRSQEGFLDKEELSQGMRLGSTTHGTLSGRLSTGSS